MRVIRGDSRKTALENLSPPLNSAGLKMTRQGTTGSQLSTPGLGGSMQARPHCRSPALLCEARVAVHPFPFAGILPYWENMSFLTLDRT